MSDAPSAAPILTLEPLIDAVRDGAAAAGWDFSGIQKTTSTEFDGRWSGESTRSAYVFFHRADFPASSIDVFLDETSSKGLRGNLALVSDVRPLWEIESVPDAVARLAELGRAHLPEGYRTPVTLRLRLADPTEDPGESELEARQKLILPSSAVRAGHDAVAGVTETTLRAFTALLQDPRAGQVLDLDG